VSGREVTFYTRQLCGLCDEAEVELRLLARALAFTLVERDIDEDADLKAQYNDIVPVIAVGETVIAHAPVEVADLRAAIAAALGA
jgi:hypothetical protein